MRGRIADWKDERGFGFIEPECGGESAANVRPAGFVAVSDVLMSKRVFLSIVALLVFPVLWWFVKQGRFPALLFWALTGMSFVAFVSYGLDKWAAIREAQRTPESTLQFCALLGGSPGASLAQQVFRHKSSKRSFQIGFWFTVVLNCGVLGFVGSSTGAVLVRQILRTSESSCTCPLCTASLPWCMRPLSRSSSGSACSGTWTPS